MVFGEFIDSVNSSAQKRGMKSLILMHGRGYGDDGPLLTPQDPGDGVRDVMMRTGNVFVWKPIVMSDDGSVEYSWGGSVVVTENGAVQLVERTPQLMAIH